MSKIIKWLLLGVLVFSLFSLPTFASYRALELNGSGYASIADGSQAGLDFGLSDFMIEGWIKVASTPAGSRYLAHKHSAGSGWFIYLTTDGHIRLYLDDGVAINANLINQDICNGRWRYFAMVADRSSNAYGYLDGVLDETVAIINSDGDLSNATALFFPHSNGFAGLMDEVRIWNFGKDGLPDDVADYITWRATARNVFLDISEYDSNSWDLYADAIQTDRHNGSGTVANLVVGERYSYVTATPHTLDYQGGTLADNGVFTATHTTGTIASGDADDHVRRAGLVAYWKFEGNLLDEGSNDNDLTAGGSGNTFPGYSLKKQKIVGSGT